MRIVDLRPWLVRAATASWRRRFGRDAIAAPGCTAWLPDAWIRQRVARRPAVPPQGPALISIGNLALGGTGKTPVVGALAVDLADRGRSGAVLVRGYGSGLAGPARVDPADERAGDEARWHAARLAERGWPVVQSRDRPAGLAFLLAERPDLDVVLLEDAHQTAGLPRHLDVVILDRWDEAAGGAGRVLAPRTGPVFPFGPWRESARGADRAGVLLVEASEPPALSVSGAPVAGFARRTEIHDVTEAAAAGWAAVSGIAHPDAFEGNAARAAGEEPALAVRCSDHAVYTPGLVARIRREMRRAGADGLLTTEKDWIKLQGAWPAGEPVRVVRQRIEWSRENALPDLVEERVRSLSV